MDNKHERKLITDRSSKRPYGAKLIFQVIHNATLGDVEHTSILLESGAIATLEPARSVSWESGKKFTLSLDAYPTASSAEREGLRLTQSLLLTAISLNFGIRLIYEGHLPVSVYERFRSRGDSFFGEGASGWPTHTLLNELNSSLKHDLFDPALTLSMELYCSGLFEINTRARFIAIVSALEPLAKQEELGEQVNKFINEVKLQLNSNETIEKNLKTSLLGRINQLRQESVRQALFRLSNTWFPNRPDIRTKIDTAYNLRSELLHNGKLSNPDCDLHENTEAISKILRSIYSQSCSQPFRASTTV